MKYWDTIASPNYNDRESCEDVSRQLMLKFVKDGWSVLDVGCATGWTYRTLKKYKENFSYKGIDYSEKMIEVCKQNHPEADFEVLSAEEMSKFEDNSFDMVYLRHLLDAVKDYRPILKEAFRICRKMVIVDNHRRLVDGGDHVINHNDEEGHEWYNCYTSDWDFDGFNTTARNLSDNVAFYLATDNRIDETNTFMVMGKKMDDIVFTLDDFHETNHNLDILLKIKEQSPNMKVTLFTIPSKCSVEWIRDLKTKYPWMEFAMHGWFHDTDRGPQEADRWTKEEALKYIQMTEDKFGDLFVKGFKAPGWQMNHETYEALQEKGYWIMDHAEYRHIRPEGFTNFYETQHLWEVNGHIQDTPFNGLENIVQNKNPFLPETKCYFVSEMAGTDKDKFRLKDLINDLCR